jgi:hypothetical protein
MLHTLKPDKLNDYGGESDSNPVACVSIKADGSSKPKKRKRSTTEEGKKTMNNFQTRKMQTLQGLVASLSVE